MMPSIRPKPPGGSRLPRWAFVGALATAMCAALLTLPWERGQLDTEFFWDRSTVPGAGEQDTSIFTRVVITIPSHGELLEAWLYMPKAAAGSPNEPPPVLIMGHGMGAQKDIGLFLYAEKFVAAGLAVLAFDYRGFGGSTGLPRHWVSPRRHLQDWEAVVSHVQATSLGGRVDAGRLALWGVSYAGGHVIVTAARFGDSIKAVIANEPYISPHAALHTISLRGVGRTARLLAAGLSDELRRALAAAARVAGLPPPLPPVYIRLVAPISDPSALALLPLQDSEMTLRSSQQPPPRRQGGWANKVLARLVIDALGYDPSRYLAALRSPLFMRLASRDHLCPPASVHGALRRAGLLSDSASSSNGSDGPGERVVLQERDVTHLQAHTTGAQDEEIAPAIAFLTRHLQLDAGAVLAAVAVEQGEQRTAEVQFPSDA